MNGPSVQADDALATRAQAEQRFDGFGAPRAHQSAQAQDFTAPGLEGHIAHPGGAASRSISSAAGAPARWRRGDWP